MQYPRFTKLIIADIMSKFPSISNRLEEEYHAIKDDTPLEYKDYVEKFRGKKRKGTPTSGEISLPRKSLKIRVRQQKPISTTLIPPPSDDRERDEIHEATQLSLALHKTTKIVEEQENVAAIENKLLEEDEEEKKDDKKDNDDDDNDDHDDHALFRTQVTSSSETRTEKIHTLIPSPLRSPRINLSSDKAPIKELTIFVTPTATPATTSQRQVDVVLNDVIPKIASNATKDLIDDNLLRIVVNAIKKERESAQAIVTALISQEFAAHAPKIIEELFRIHMQNTVLNVYPTTSTSNATTSIADLQQQLYLKTKSNLQDQVADPELWEILRAKFEKSSASVGPCRTDAFRKRDHDDHQGDNVNPEGEKSAKRQKTSKDSKSAKGSSSKQPVQKSKTSAFELQ
ncbi:hypothetical protein Tco_0617061 [Tanacetum coccineum]